MGGGGTWGQGTCPHVHGREVERNGVLWYNDVVRAVKQRAKAQCFHLDVEEIPWDMGGTWVDMGTGSLSTQTWTRNLSPCPPMSMLRNVPCYEECPLLNREKIRLLIYTNTNW